MNVWMHNEIVIITERIWPGYKNKDAVTQTMMEAVVEAAIDITYNDGYYGETTREAVAGTVLHFLNGAKLA